MIYEMFFNFKREKPKPKFYGFDLGCSESKKIAGKEIKAYHDAWDKYCKTRNPKDYETWKKKGDIMFEKLRAYYRSKGYEVIG